MVLGLPFAHTPSRFANDGCRGHDIDAVDPGQVRTAHAKQPFAQIELWRIPLLLPASPLALFFRQRGTLAPILSLLEILCELAIALGYLLLAKLVTTLFLLQHTSVSALEISEISRPETPLTCQCPICAVTGKVRPHVDFIPMDEL